MNNIKTENDVIDWAKAIADGKGEKFIALSKGDMFAIAKYILGISDTEPAPSTNPHPRQEWTPAPAPDPDQKPDAELAVHDADGVEVKPQAPAETETRKIEMSMGCALHLKGKDAQQAYDQYLDAVKNHPKAKNVMDFSTGQSSSFAAFAYWLNQPVTVVIKGNVATMEKPDGKRN